MAKETFWTARRLRELRTKARKLDLSQLAKHYAKAEPDVRQALAFANNMQKMRIEKVKELICGKAVDVVKIKPGYALGAKPIRTFTVGYSPVTSGIEPLIYD